jgi:predicted PurR-regulated permease PerM
VSDTESGSGRISVPRWVQLALLPVLVILAWFVFVRIGEAIFIFICAGFIALVLNPLVHLLKRAHVPRAVGVFVVYLVFVAALVGIGALIGPPMVRQLRNLLSALPGMTAGASGSVDRLQSWASRLHLHLNVRHELTTMADSLSNRIPSASRSLLSMGMSVMRAVTITIIIVVVSIYMLLDSKRLGRFVADHFPTHSRQDGEAYVALAQNAVVSYVKAQLLLSAVLGTSVGLVMWFLAAIGAFPSGGKYAVFFGAWTAVMEAIPYIGPVMAAVPPTIVALFHSSLSALWVIVAFIVIQQVEGHVLVPLIMGGRFRVHPLIVIFAVLAGNQIHGVVGMFLAIPLIPLVKETIVFMRPRLVFEGLRPRPEQTEPSEGRTPPGDALHRSSP